MESTPAQNDLLLRLLAAAELRARVVSGNLANIETPGYTRRDVRFEDLLRKALERGKGTAGIEARVEPDRTAPARPDGNNVSLELELNALRENRLLYEAYAAILEGRMDLQRIAVTEGR
jgi:flagellar basal-body rod protein FlgB